MAHAGSGRRMSMSKRNRSAKYCLSDKQLDKVKEKIAAETTAKAILLTLAATADELRIDADAVANIAVRVERYAGYLDDHLISINAMRDNIKEKTGIDLIGF